MQQVLDGHSDGADFMQTPLDVLDVALEQLGNLFIMPERKQHVNVSLYKG